MGEQGAQQGRVDWVDAAKGFGIILVVVGHVIRGLSEARILTETAPVRCIDIWIYSFHMPLFFFLTGLFIAKSAEKNTLAHFMFDKVATLAYPYIVWSIVTILLKTALGPLPNTPRNLRDLPQIFYQPIEQYWFLYTLFVLSIGFKLLYSTRTTFWFFLAAAIVIHPDATSLRLDSKVFDDVSKYAIYFAIGAAVSSMHLRSIDSLGFGALASIGTGGSNICGGSHPPPAIWPLPGFCNTGHLWRMCYGGSDFAEQVCVDLQVSRSSFSRNIRGAHDGFCWNQSISGLCARELSLHSSRRRNCCGLAGANRAGHRSQADRRSVCLFTQNAPLI